MSFGRQYTLPLGDLPRYIRESAIRFVENGLHRALWVVMYDCNVEVLD